MIISYLNKLYLCGIISLYLGFCGSAFAQDAIMDGSTTGQISVENLELPKINRQYIEDTILTTTMYMDDKNSVRNDSSIYLPWHNNVISVSGVFQQGDSINYFDKGIFDTASGTVYLGRKNPVYKNRPISIVYKYRITPEQELKYFGGFSVDLGLARFKKCILQDVYGNDKNIVWPGSFIDLEFYAGRKNFYTSLGLRTTSAHLIWFDARDTIIIGDSCFSPHKLIFFQAPCLIHYIYPVTKRLTYVPEAGITYSWLNSEIREYKFYLGTEIININQNMHSIAAQIGLGVELNTSVSLGRVLGGKSHLCFSGKYDYTTAFNGANLYELAIGSKMSSTIPLWRKREAKLFFRQYRNGWLSVQEYGLMATILFN